MALNYQTPDKPNQYNRAFFTINGNCGYVLKPKFLRDTALTYNPVPSNDLEESRFPSWTLTVQGSIIFLYFQYFLLSNMCCIFVLFAKISLFLPTRAGHQRPALAPAGRRVRRRGDRPVRQGADQGPPRRRTLEQQAQDGAREEQRVPPRVGHRLLQVPREGAAAGVHRVQGQGSLEKRLR